MQVERVDFVAIPARDLERSRAFYRDVLADAPSKVRAG